MRGKYINDDHVAARYLANQLVDGERERFEDCYLVRVEVVHEIELAAQFKVGLSHLHAMGELDALLKLQSRYVQQPPFNPLPRWRS